VDPLHGDNNHALARNPVSGAPSPGRPRALSLHPDFGEALDPHPISGVLQHAPFPFRTLTEAGAPGQGAIAYARQFVRASNGGQMWSNFINTATNPKTVYISHVVIHCLPGLYGPFSLGVPPPRIDPQSGLPFNGEIWPAELLDGMSIQGTSALDTIFDGRGLGSHILGVRGDPGAATNRHFIDSVTIRNAGYIPGLAGTGAGIWIYPAQPPLARGGARISITNCFIVANTIGVAVDSSVGPTGITHEPQFPVIVNNTFGWNFIGLWSGNTRAAPPFPPAVSENHVTLINNVFDSGDPYGSVPPGAGSGFEGISGPEKQVVQRGTTQLAPPGIDFNAWEDANLAQPRHVNRGPAAPNIPEWPITLPGAGAFTGPRVSITPFTLGGLVTAARAGQLFVNDVLRVALGGIGLDYSPHDFRLAPVATVDGGGAPNPLVNQGIDSGGPLNAFPILMGDSAALGLVQAPGLVNGSEGPMCTGQPLPFTRIDGWDYDTEGFGNPRIQIRAGFGVGTNEGIIDLGADEMGRLIIGGYLNGTRIFSPVPPGTTVAASHEAVYFFDLPALNNSLRPETNIYDADVFTNWWTHKQAPGMGPPDLEDQLYTEALAGVRPGGTRSERYFDINATRMFAPDLRYDSFSRSLDCDFSPHLAPDPHPFWGLWMSIPPAPDFFGDIYGCNPWFNHSDAPSTAPVNPKRRRDNPALFHNVCGTGSTSWGTGFSGPMYVLDATINPPGTYPPGTGFGNRWTLPATTTFGPYTPCSGASPTQYSVNGAGLGDAGTGCPDVIPYVGAAFVDSTARFNCEVIVNGVSASNLQTFLGIRFVVVIPPGSDQRAARPPSTVRETMRLNREQMQALIRSRLRGDR
jgi:hypothetical protein